MGLFDGIEKVSASQSSTYLGPGHYFAVIHRCKTGETRGGKNFFAVEMEIVKVLDDANGIGHKANDEVTWMVTKGDMFLPDIKGFIAAICDCAPDDVTAEMCEGIVAVDGDDPNPLQWTIAEVKAAEQPMRSKAGVFTKVTWKREVPIGEATNDDSVGEALLKACGEEVLGALMEAAE